MFTIFYEPSTRTRLSFAAAGAHLGMQVTGTENAGKFSSAIKGESLEDSIRVLCEYCPDVIVLRHDKAGAAERAAMVAGPNTFIVNAGDGDGQHPTQALLDLYTISQEKGRLEDLTVVMGGDLANGRTVRSLAYLLSKFDGVRLVFVSPAELSMKEDIKAHLNEHKIDFQEEASLEAALRAADVVYWTRIQRERIQDENLYAKVKDVYRIGPREMDFLKPEAVLMHPLPRVDEIAKEVDNDRRAVYFKQTGYGMFMRMSLLAHLFEVEV